MSVRDVAQLECALTALLHAGAPTSIDLELRAEFARVWDEWQWAHRGAGNGYDFTRSHPVRKFRGALRASAVRFAMQWHRLSRTDAMWTTRALLAERGRAVSIRHLERVMARRRQIPSTPYRLCTTGH